MMRQLLRRVLFRTSLYDRIRRLRQQRELRFWERRGSSDLPPPPAFKQRLVRDTAERFSLRVLVETGTFFGDMIAATREAFDEIYSIELDRRLYQRATARFRRDDRVRIVPGDSGEMLPAVLATVAGRPCLFWLDAHLIGGGVRGKLTTPIIHELRAVLGSDLDEAVILVDDARLFNEASDYPTLDQVRELVRAGRPDWTLLVEHDIVRIHRGE